MSARAGSPVDPVPVIALRTPADVPDVLDVADGGRCSGFDPYGAREVREGIDTDGDGHPDTILTVVGGDLVVHSDLDGDGLADQVLGIGPDATVLVLAPDVDPVSLWEP
jgi:hypothetical protein